MNCRTCAAIQEAGPETPNTVVARSLGIAESTVRRHKANPHDLDPLATTDEFFSDIPDAIITSRGRSIRLEDGSWEKINYRPQDLALHEAKTTLYEDFEESFRNYKYPIDIQLGHEGTMVVCAADLQIGKTSYLGGTDELVERVMSAIHGTTGRIITEKPKQVVLADLGDLLEGFGNTVQQTATNDRDLTTQIRLGRRLLMEAIKAFAPHTEELVFVSVPSNHCEVRSGIGAKTRTATVDNDLGLEISYQLEDVFMNRPGFNHVTFLRPETLHEAVTFTTLDGTVLAFAHGHQAKSPDKVGEWWRGQSHGRISNLHNADILIHGHFHSLRVSQSGNERWLICAPTIDAGSDWFTSRTGESSTPGMLAFSVKNKMWHDLAIL